MTIKSISSTTSTPINIKFSLNEPRLSKRTTCGDLCTLTSNEFPILKKLSIQHLVLQVGGVREPHWHGNANKIIYCLYGSALITIVGNHGKYNTFGITEGQACFVPSGYAHHVENMRKDGTSKFIIGLSHELPEEFNFSMTFGPMSDKVLGNTFRLPDSAFKDVIKLKRGEPTLIGKMKQITNVANDRVFTNSNEYKFDFERRAFTLTFPEGSIKIASHKHWPIIKNISMSSLCISAQSIREPYWRPEAAEMGLVVNGYARISILLPNDGHQLHTFSLQNYDVYFIPPGYPHYIENIGDADLKILMFFDQSNADDIGYKGGLLAYSREVLSATFQCDSKQIPTVSFNRQNLIVKRVNPIDN
ncbi:unnamed protein product [Rotaria socialis]|uniref:Cupin type-1 domain-containing protein n=3 Tax=Rotaria TaxID=231623 RepID=A0A821TTU1_9BILA|nr:unnamed protein product [Rotaria socialis]